MISRHLFVALSHAFATTTALDITCAPKRLHVPHAETIRKSEVWKPSEIANVIVYCRRHHEALCSLLNGLNSSATNILFVPKDALDTTHARDLPIQRVSGCLLQSGKDLRRLKPQLPNAATAGFVFEPPALANPMCDTSEDIRHTLNALIFESKDGRPPLQPSSQPLNAGYFPWTTISGSFLSAATDELGTLDAIGRSRCLILASETEAQDWQIAAATILGKPIFDVRPRKPAPDDISAASILAPADLDLRSILIWIENFARKEGTWSLAKLKSRHFAMKRFSRSAFLQNLIRSGHFSTTA
ncbi:hypothetical protein [Shimia haliotis]|uniref:hypothetical protein n=1 Tax=Shimia haliotis TaxID=1280847 RepID=UPI00148187B0|nr:hypothetical protein [Shimia haliotis]